MNLSPIERLLLAGTFVLVAYRALRDEWPIGLEVEPTEGAE